jgi:nitrate/nitrite-specific signal transduction histidine kinase
MVTVLVLVMAAASYLQLRQISPSSEVIIHNSLDLDHLQHLAAATAALDADLERYLVIPGVEYQENVQNDLLTIGESLENLQENPVPEIQGSITELEEVVTRLQVSVQQLMEARSANVSSRQINRQIVALYSDIEMLKGLQDDLSAKVLENLQSTAVSQGTLAEQVLSQSMVLGIIVVLLAVVTAFMSDRRLRAISELTRTATAIAGGDLERTASVESKDEIGVLAIAFNTMTGKLREQMATLEQRVAERTRALQTSTEVSRRLSTILDQNELVKAVVYEVQQAFDYYHAQIYLFDEAGENLVMVGGTSQAGQQMLARGHKIPKGRGLVGRAAESGEVVLVSDTTANPDWLPNPLLPETRSEVAVPIKIGKQVLGVLDVQQDRVDGLTEQDVSLLTSVANQVAVAVQNAQLYTQTRQKAEREAKINLIGQKLQQTLTIEDTLQVALVELSQALDASRAAIRVSRLQTNGGREHVKTN